MTGAASAGPSSVDRHGYQYVVLRCVPRADREEFVNVGLVLYCQAADYLCSASHMSATRLTALAPHLDLEAVASALRAVEAICHGAGGRAAELSLGQRFGWLAAPRSTVVQPGPVHGGLTDDPARQLEQLVETLVS
jgi:hypothetical protein